MAGGVAARLCRRVATGLSGVAVGAAALFTFAPVAGAADIQTIVCREPSAVTINRPANDTVVTEGSMQIQGTVRQANQLEVYVDSVLDSVVPLSVADTTYAATVQLRAGTHTVTVTSIDACQIGNADAAVVVTYQPASPEPSVGAAIPTIVGGEPGVRIGDTPAITTPASPMLPLIIAKPLQRIGDFLDLNTGHDVMLAGQGAISQTARLGLMVAGGLMMIFSQAISSLRACSKVLQFAAMRVRLDTAAGSRWLVVLLGAISVVMAFLL